MVTAIPQDAPVNEETEFSGEDDGANRPLPGAVTAQLSLSTRAASPKQTTPNDTRSSRIHSLQLDRNSKSVAAPLRTRWGLWGLLLLTFAAVAWYVAFGSESVATLFPGTPEYQVYEAETATVVFESSGYIVTESEILVSPKVPGTIVELHFEEGQVVTKGDLLAVLDDEQYQIDFQGAQASLQKAEARYNELKAGARPEEIERVQAALDRVKGDLAFAQKHLDRVRQLVNKKSRTAFHLEDAEAKFQRARQFVKETEAEWKILKQGPRQQQLDAAAADMAQAQAAADKAWYFLKSTKVYAPVNGKILRKNADPGETVRPEAFSSAGGLSTSLCEMANLDNMEVEFQIPERDLQKAHVDQHCWIIPDAYPDRLYHGQVHRIRPVVNVTQGVVELVVKILESDESLLPRMNCRVQLLASDPESTDAPPVRIPSEAVRIEGEETVAFVLEGETARRRVIELTEGSHGNERGPATLVEVTRGLKPGDKLLLLKEGVNISDGETVRISIGL